MTKEELLAAIAVDPMMMRQPFEDAEIAEAFRSIGVFTKVVELHAPSKASGKRDGLGETLCGIKGTRHAIVTCERCKKRLAKRKR